MENRFVVLMCFWYVCVERTRAVRVCVVCLLCVFVALSSHCSLSLKHTMLSLYAFFFQKNRPPNLTHSHTHTEHRDVLYT